MIDFADTVTLTWAAAQGAPGAGPVVLTLTLPDGTSATPTVTGPVSGTWSATYVTTQAGHHTARWTGGGQSYTDAFDVDEAAPAGIVSLADAKAHLNITSTTNDEEIRAIIDAATEWVESRVGPVVRRTVTQTILPASDGRLYADGPIISVTSITSTYGYTTAYSVGTTFLDGPGGVIIPAYSSTFSTPVVVVYVAGRVVVPAAIRVATLMMVKALWETQRGATPLPTPGFEDNVDMAGNMGMAVWRAEALLEPYRLAPAVA